MYAKDLYWNPPSYNQPLSPPPFHLFYSIFPVQPTKFLSDVFIFMSFLSFITLARERAHALGAGLLWPVRIGSGFFMFHSARILGEYSNRPSEKALGRRLRSPFCRPSGQAIEGWRRVHTACHNHRKVSIDFRQVDVASPKFQQSCSCWFSIIITKLIIWDPA